MFKELITLIKLLKRKPIYTDRITEVIDMKHFPLSGYKAMMWCGVIIHRIGTSAIDERSIRHESIHCRQAYDKGSWIKYYLDFIKEYVKIGIVWHPVSACYYMNKYELEAYAKEDETDYLTRRLPNAVDKFVIDKPKEKYRSVMHTYRTWVKDYFKEI